MLSPHRLREYTLRLLLSRIKVLGSLLQVYGLPILQAIANATQLARELPGLTRRLFLRRNKGIVQGAAFEDRVSVNG